MFAVCIKNSTLGSLVILNLNCIVLGEIFSVLTQEVQQELYSLNHPEDCSRAALLVCSTSVHKFQGTGTY